MKGHWEKILVANRELLRRSTFPNCPFGPTAALVPCLLQLAVQTATDAAGQRSNDSQALTLATTAGVREYLTAKILLNDLFKIIQAAKPPAKQSLKYIARQPEKKALKNQNEYVNTVSR
jgi:hypothetical protein